MSKPNKVWKDGFGCRCWYCGIKCTSAGNLPNSFTLDHVVPLSKGGREDADNIVPCCKSCNSTKGSKSVEEFRFFKAMTTYHPVSFSIEQVNYLETLGFVMPIPVYKFYFEVKDEKNDID